MQRRADLQRFPCPSSLFPVPCKPHQPSPTFASLSPTSRLQTTFIKVTRRRTQFMRTSIHGNPLSPSRRRRELPRLLYCTYLRHRYYRQEMWCRAVHCTRFRPSFLPPKNECKRTASQLTKEKSHALLTTPFCTENPSWYFVSGRLILTSTTGAHETAVSFTAVFVLVFCAKKKERKSHVRNRNSIASLPPFPFAIDQIVSSTSHGPSSPAWL